jgi:hypothetical protein
MGEDTVSINENSRTVTGLRTKLPRKAAAIGRRLDPYLSIAPKLDVDWMWPTGLDPWALPSPTPRWSFRRNAAHVDGSGELRTMVPKASSPSDCPLLTH